MTDSALKAERLRLKQEIAQLNNTKDQSAVSDEISFKKRRRLELKDELKRRHEVREAAEQAAAGAIKQPETIVKNSPQFVTADGGPYHP